MRNHPINGCYYDDDGSLSNLKYQKGGIQSTQLPAKGRLLLFLVSRLCSFHMASREIEKPGWDMSLWKAAGPLFILLLGSLGRPGLNF